VLITRRRVAVAIVVAALMAVSAAGGAAFAATHQPSAAPAPCTFHTVMVQTVDYQEHETFSAATETFLAAGDVPRAYLVLDHLERAFAGKVSVHDGDQVPIPGHTACRYDRETVDFGGAMVTVTSVAGTAALLTVVEPHRSYTIEAVYSHGTWRLIDGKA
jgi:hypothetical protein